MGNYKVLDILQVKLDNMDLKTQRLYDGCCVKIKKYNINIWIGDVYNEVIIEYVGYNTKMEIDLERPNIKGFKKKLKNMIKISKMLRKRGIGA